MRRAVFVDEQALFAGDDRDARDDDRRTRCTPSASASGAVVGAVRLYPLDAAGLWKGDRLAVLPECARTARSAARSCASPSRTAGARGGARMVAQIQLPNVRFFEPLGWARDGAAARYHGRRCTSRWRSRSAAPDAVSGSAAQVPHRPPRAAAGQAQHAASRRSAPQGAQARPRRVNAAHAASACSGAAASRKPKLGNVSSQRSSGDARRGAGGASSVERRAAAGELEHLQQRAGDAGHRDVARGVAEPALGDLDERLAVVAQRSPGRGRAAR